MCYFNLKDKCKDRENLSVRTSREAASGASRQQTAKELAREQLL